MNRSDDPRVLVLGASGQVGREVMAETSRPNAQLHALAAARSHSDPARRFELDSAGSIEALLKHTQPDHIILTAAATNVAWCEEHPDESALINVDGTRAVADAAARNRATLTFISTDYVFDGRNGPSGEAEPPNPINVYGTHKLAAESAVMAASPSNLVVRTCQVFGNDPRRANYVIGIVDRLRRSETVTAAGDLWGTPTYAPDLARALITLTLSGAAGVWHVAGETFLSRYDLAVMAARAFACDPGAIVRVSHDQMTDRVNRPRRAGLRNERLEAAGIGEITPLAQALYKLAAAEERP